MAVIQRIAFACVTVMLAALPAYGQSIVGEVAQTGGYSTDGTGAGAVQGRAVGDAAGVRFNVEGSWAARSGGEHIETDAFGAAYPYENRLKLIEAYGERMFRPGGSLIAVRGGRFRTPFGISSGSDHAYAGYLRPPLIRYDDYYALSNNFIEHGVSVTAGVPRLQVEATLAAPDDVGEAVRPNGLDRVVRLQGAWRSLIVGVSHIVTKPYQDPRWAKGDAVFTGIDGRWMYNGLEVRGEWLDGRPFDGTTTTGGYLDVRVHTPRLGAVVPVFRAERLDYVTSSPHAIYPSRFTGGARVQIAPRLTAQVNVLRQHGVPEQHDTAVDVALSYVVRFEPKRSN
jgi:hypothetical protein